VSIPYSIVLPKKKLKIPYHGQPHHIHHFFFGSSFLHLAFGCAFKWSDSFGSNFLGIFYIKVFEEKLRKKNVFFFSKQNFATFSEIFFFEKKINEFYFPVFFFFKN
jgi:hypothetical protein